MLEAENKIIACEKSSPNANAIVTALQHNPSLKATFTVREFSSVAQSSEQRGVKSHLAYLRRFSKQTQAINTYKRCGENRVHIVDYDKFERDINE